VKLLRTIIAAILSVAIPLPAFAQPHVIAQLGSEPLVPQITSTPQLQNDVKRNRQLFESAGMKLGLTPAEYARFSMRISSRELTYVTIPRHLDAMSGSKNGRVFVVRDVIIPANTKGWEVDLQEPSETVSLFIPARCGNLSIVRRSVPAIARRPLPLIARAQAANRKQPRRVQVEAAAVAPMPTAMPAPRTSPAASRVVAVPVTASSTPAPFETVAVSTPPHRRGIGWWPLLLIPIVALIAGSHGGTTSVPPITSAPAPPPAPPPAPTPPPGCATPSP
jgi:hypothetical protein